MNSEPAPVQLAQLGLDPSSFKYSDKKSWRGSCPECGGSRRFVMFTDHEWPLWNGYCSLCGATIKAWERVRVQVDPVKRAAFIAEREAEEKRREDYRRKKLAEFTDAELWMELSERMEERHVLWWEDQGIPQSIQKYLCIGYTPDKAYYNSEKVLMHSEAYTIPWFGYGYKFNTMQYRLFADTDRRYIFENDLGGGRYYYMATPDKPIRDKVIICEGAKKAINTWLWLAPDGFTVLAAASANTFGAALEATKDCGLRYVIFDPDVKPYWRRKALATNPKTTAEASFPFKIDDAANANWIDRRMFTQALEQARRV